MVAKLLLGWVISIAHKVVGEERGRLFLASCSGREVWRWGVSVRAVLWDGVMGWLGVDFWGQGRGKGVMTKAGKRKGIPHI